MQPLHERETPAAAPLTPPPIEGKREGGSSCRAQRTIAVASWLYLSLVFAAWATIRAGDLWWPATLLMFGPRWLLLLPLLPLLLAAACRRRRSLVLLLLALLLILGPIMGFNIPWPIAAPASPRGMRLRVLTCNMHHQRPNAAALERLFAAMQPDVVAIQELRSRTAIPSFDGEDWHVYRTSGHFLASRYPIRRAVRLGEDSMKPPGSLMRYELETPSGPVTLFSLHFASPREGLYEATHRPAKGAAELELNSDVRRHQAENLLDLADRVTGPVLLMGDFNTPSESALFRRVWSRYTDTFSAAGWGWGYTFLSAKTAVRIDHILTDSRWHCEHCWVGPNIGPPHRPVLADLILPAPRP